MREGQNLGTRHMNLNLEGQLSELPALEIYIHATAESRCEYHITA